LDQRRFHPLLEGVAVNDARGVQSPKLAAVRKQYWIVKGCAVVEVIQKCIIFVDGMMENHSPQQYQVYQQNK